MAVTKWLAGAVVLAAAVIGGGYLLATQNDGYQVKLVMPNAANLLDGSRVEIDGKPVGSVTKLETRDSQALVTVSVDDAHAPLHTGSTAQVQWRGLLGERVVELMPGPAGNPRIPSGAMLPAGSEQVELDQVLAALDPATRSHLDSVVQQLDQNLKAHPQDIKATLDTAGPAVNELGEVLKAVGQDGPAISNLIGDLHQMMDPVVARQVQVRQVIGNLTSATDSLAAEQSQLQQALGALPSTLDAARGTMDSVPAAVDASVPLLKQLQPATSQLAGLSQNLSPLLADLRPTIADLRPTLQAANKLLQTTPALLDSANGVLPGATQAVTQLNPAVSFLRPYTPDVMGWLSNWGAAFANYDAQGHYFHGLVQVSTSIFDDNPGADVGLKGGPNSTPAPGMASGRPWVDANGSGPR
ncbi:MCE family protein [Amycolatopsis sp. K13G38]|uniref:MCE family protein n=1 Tax=Amycolatopsis acididurans TaxID=2724524 RepID=A0ABX1J9B2_9PSEU|nr:MlaD family protein [Amycolatopsis acididurans]NKQ55479.1 MCE family protein [Amycolatopsis acididurans]